MKMYDFCAEGAKNHIFFERERDFVGKNPDIPWFFRSSGWSNITHFEALHSGRITDSEASGLLFLQRGLR